MAMKLMSGRQYKNDILDVIGILREQKALGKPLTFERIQAAVCALYDSWENLPQDSRNLITEIMRDEQYEVLYEQYRSHEKMAKESLIDFEKKYPGVTNMDNVNDIIRNLKKRKEQEH